jgi:hypothetical protein
MNGIPIQKPSDDLTRLKRVQFSDIKEGKFYFIRTRNKDTSPDIWGIKMDFIAKINKINSTGISFFIYYERSGDPRHGKPKWKKTENMALIPMESILHRNINDNTTFYIVENKKVKRDNLNKTKILKDFRTFFGFTRKQRR